MRSIVPSPRRQGRNCKGGLEPRLRAISREDQRSWRPRIVIAMLRWRVGGETATGEAAGDCDEAIEREQRTRGRESWVQERRRLGLIFWFLSHSWGYSCGLERRAEKIGYISLVRVGGFTLRIENWTDIHRFGSNCSFCLSLIKIIWLFERNGFDEARVLLEEV